MGQEDVGLGLIEEGMLMVDEGASKMADEKGAKKLAKLVKEYKDAMARAKKNQLNIWNNGSSIDEIHLCNFSPLNG